MTETIWAKAPENLCLSENQVHIWRACLNSQESLPDVLSSEELQRGKRFLQEQHRRRFCQSRTFLRIILSKYLQILPDQIQFKEGAHGKLYLLDHLNPYRLQFNLSHSEELALYILGVYDEVGIDTEWENPNIPVLCLAERFFSKRETQKLQTLSEKERLQTFYYFWTRKEAYLKTLGIGLGGLSQIPGDDDLTSVVSLNPAPNYAGAWCSAKFDHQDFAQMADVSYFESA